MKLERHRTVFFVFIAGLAFADLVGIFLTTFPVLLVYSGYYFGEDFGGVRDSTNLSFFFKYYYCYIRNIAHIASF
jgi:hypothetical protein